MTNQCEHGLWTVPCKDDSDWLNSGGSEHETVQNYGNIQLADENDQLLD